MYLLIDSGDQKKIEKVGQYIIERPCSIAIWKPFYKDHDIDARFSRKKGWEIVKKMPLTWKISMENIFFKIGLTEFGHIGVFPEHIFLHKKMQKMMRKKKNKKIKILNLFAYTGGASFAAAKEGGDVTHVDSSKPSILWARENAQLNKVTNIRWIVEDALKFLKKERKRGNTYDGIILDPPTFGRGVRGEVFKIERDLKEVLEICADLLSEDALFLILSCHTPGFTDVVLENILFQIMKKNVKSGDMFLSSDNFLVPSGSYAIWENI